MEFIGREVDILIHACGKWNKTGVDEHPTSTAKVRNRSEKKKQLDDNSIVITS